MIISNLIPRISYGGDYNPEQWERSVWQEDVELMKEAGVNMVSLGIFSWASLEKKEDDFSFEWLDEIMDLLHDNGISIDLATATASTPGWFVRKYPESLPVDEKGSRYAFGSRQHYCPNNFDLKRRIQVIVTKLAERYQSHPGLKMWHINNEYACHVSRCYCNTCANAFRTWLKNRYVNLEELNDRWGTRFWSQYYYEWEEINPPRMAPTFSNPGHELDYTRFMNDSIFQLYLTERDILRRLTPTIPITTNFMGPFKPLNYFEWAKEMDIVSWDSYPDPTEGTPVTQAMWNDLMRSFRKGQPFFLMEQVTSHVNWRDINVPKSPGVMRAWSYATIGRGADGILFFQWRQSKAGSEKFHGAMVSHAPKEKSRTYQEVKQLGNELKKLEKITGSTIEAKVAILFDFENWWAFDLPSKPHNKINYIEQVQNYFRPFYEKNIPVDFVQPSDDLEQYDLVLAPLLYMVKQGEDKMLEQFVSKGGTLVVSFFSGIVDENDRVHLGGYPGPLRDLLGIYVEEFVPLAENECSTFSSNNKEISCGLWREHIHLEGANVLAAFKEDNFLGRSPVITENQYGKGKSVYIGTDPERGYLSELLLELASEKNISPLLNVPENVEVSVRVSKEKQFLIIVNHNDEQVTVNIPNFVDYQAIIGADFEEENLVLCAYGVAVLEK
ncbi:MAG: beta-galactosidase [Anaerobacillus sp.]|uniref:beta-galactosidase n=1 Tax=Anaerobacillus sp. TaxID=1872506 RepID=UPI00391DD460